ncbi:hypothetical protein Ddye_018299 [Dipteronia dyeriana]|uniref:Uncharacterized protein n=1 Tax=Dipteronia dyeriana TaxID=168575 RepID=A0AAD9UAT7_9ROSI|nr:hypothetical protein Ddye_018299 [Dipteronia dyeriana]
MNNETLPISTEKDDPTFVTSEEVDGLQRGGASGPVQRYCIFKLDENFELFDRTPNSISIGPIHSETLKLKPMQLVKEKLASNFSARVGEIIMGDFRNFLIVNEARIRGSYAYDTSKIASEKLIAIILCDATFFIELIYKSMGVGDFQNDIFENNIEKEEVMNELMFLENQIPLFIHLELCDKCGINIDQFVELFYKLFNMKDSIGIGLNDCTLDLRSEVLHLLDLRRLMEMGWVKENKTATNHVQVDGATVLAKYGFKFQPIKGTMFSFELSKSCITCLPLFKMPRLYMDVGWELRILNMMAFEILYFHDTKKMPLCQFMHLLNCLVQNFEDMSLLNNRKVIIVVSSDKDQVYEKLKDIGRRMKISIRPAICEELDKAGDDCHVCKAEFRTMFCSCETIRNLVPGVLPAGTLGAIHHLSLDWLLNRLHLC